MITNAIETLQKQLNKFLKDRLGLNDEIVFIQLPDDKTTDTKVCMSFINIEKEHQTASVYDKVKYIPVIKYKSPFNISLNVLISVTNNKNHLNTIKILDAILYFFQLNNNIKDKENNVFFLELCNTNFSELSNIWSVTNGTNYPFVVAKIRNIIISNDMIELQPSIFKIEFE